MKCPVCPDATLVMTDRHQPGFEDSDYRDRQRHPHSRKKSWLSEIFD